jgi:hypothetical protein
MCMLSKRVFLTLATILVVAPTAQGARPRTHVQIIVKACPAIEQTGQDHKPNAVMGYYADPINQGLIYDNERSPTKGGREAYFATQHCIDVPIPPEVTTSGQVSADLSLAQCIGHRGYLSAMQYLEMNPAYKNSFPAVGEWECIEEPYEAAGVTGM